MLERLELTNFQCHRKLIIDFDPYVNVLCGPSDVGKSSIIRALKWIATNKPTGDAFINHSCSEAKATLFVDGHKITRKKGKKNLYLVDGRKLAAFGNGVPDDVAEILNMGEVNVSLQHSPSFWFFKTAGELAKELNNVVNLSLIDKTLSVLASARRRVKEEIAISEERLQKAAEQQKKLSWVTEANEHLCTIEQKYARMESIRSKRDRIQSLLERRATLVRQRQIALEANVVALEAKRQLDRVERLRARIDKLQLVMQERDKLCLERESRKRDLEQLKEQLRRETKGKCPLCRRPLALS